MQPQLFETPEDVIEEDAGQMADELPAPIYRPQQVAAQKPAPQQVRSTAALSDDAGDFVAPRPRAAGTPTPEALARLQAAVSKAPSQAPAQRQPQQPAPTAAAPEAPRPRFGIGSLINRMAGGGHAEATERPAQPQRQQPPVTSYDDEQDMSASQERIEIPAFLRRQAN